MPSLSITDSFDHSPPNGTRSSTEQSPNAHISGPSTRNAEAPGFAVEVPYQTIWNAYADNVLRRVDLTRHRLVSWEDTRRLLIEADVSDAAAAQLINPVDLALSTRHPNEIVCLNQHLVGSARADKSWGRDTPYGIQIFAALDYKRPGVIRTHEFADGLVKVDMYNQRVVEVQSGTIFFEGNALILLKQAVNYADQYKTTYIAFFDWDILLLFVMADLEGPTGGVWCYATLIRNRRNVRRALLGFLERAYQASLTDESYLPPLIPPPADNAAAGSSRKGRRR